LNDNLLAEQTHPVSSLLNEY